MLVIELHRSKSGMLPDSENVRSRRQRGTRKSELAHRSDGDRSHNR